MNHIKPISPVIQGESQEEFDAFAEEIIRTWPAADVHERFLVEEMINNGWRLRRLRRIEAQAPRVHFEPRVMRELQSLIASVERSCHRAEVALRRLHAPRAARRRPGKAASLQSLKPGIGLVPLFWVQ